LRNSEFSGSSREFGPKNPSGFQAASNGSFAPEGALGFEIQLPLYQSKGLVRR
jgi:hypothetical protein